MDVSYQIESPGNTQSDMFQLYPELEQVFRVKPLEPYEGNHLQREGDKDNILPESPKSDISGANEDNFYDIPLGIPNEERNVPGEPLTPEDFENALKLELLVPPQEEGSVDPLEVAGLFQGDIAGVNISDLVLERNAIRDLGLRWSHGIVPYVISASFSVYERSVIAAAFLDYHQHSCIKFVPRTTQQDYVYLLKGAGCSSAVGRQGGSQQVSLGPGCLYKGIIVHELMHAVGFWHEQSRGDRDHFVTVLWDNIQRGETVLWDNIQR
uniref:Metalloendopeptidase n=1 Tax=Timema bartmani TaxID=61472 RepID=A0A7R9F383_9NEOP|nr:unnamed protein product [Timema bartmani]